MVLPIHLSVNGGEINIKLNNRYVKCDYAYRGTDKDLTYRLLKYLKKKYDLDTIGFYLASRYRDLRYLFQVPYNKEALAQRTFTKDKCIADYNTGYDVYFYVKSDTKVHNTVYDDKVTANKESIKKNVYVWNEKKTEFKSIIKQLY